MIDGTTTRRLASPACLPIRRRDDAACLPTTRRSASARLPTRATERRTTRRTATRPTTRRHGTRERRDERRDDEQDERRDEKTGRSYEKKGGPKTGRDMRLNETLPTTRYCYHHRNRHPPANEGNQGAENDNTHTAHASSQSPPEYHQSTKSLEHQNDPKYQRYASA